MNSIKLQIRFAIYGLLISSLFLANSSVFAASTLSPKEILKKKYPYEVATVIKTADLNGDNKKESFILTETGRFFVVNYKGVISHIASDILSEEDAPKAEIEIYSVSKKQKLVAIKYYYFPGNTQFISYKYTNGTLKRVLSVMGDLSVKTDKNNGTVYQYWKKYNSDPDIGGWDPVKTSFKWDTSAGKYRNVGTVGVDMSF